MFEATTTVDGLEGNATHGRGVVVIRAAGDHDFSPIPEEGKLLAIGQWTSDSCRLLWRVRQTLLLEFHYDHGTILGQPNSALLTLILMMATFFLASYLDSLKRSFYFGRTVRSCSLSSYSIRPIFRLLVSRNDRQLQRPNRSSNGGISC